MPSNAIRFTGSDNRLLKPRAKLAESDGKVGRSRREYPARHLLCQINLARPLAHVGLVNSIMGQKAVRHVRIAYICSRVTKLLLCLSSIYISGMP